MNSWPQNLPGKPQALRSYLSSEMLALLQKGGRFDYELSISTHSLPMSLRYFETLKLTLTVTETVLGMVEVS